MWRTNARNHCSLSAWSILCCQSVFLVLSIPLHFTNACPTACICKWKGGKETVECVNLGLIFIPDNIDPRTQVLDLSGSKFQSLKERAFANYNLLNLQKIFLNNCQLGDIHPKAFEGLTNLVELDLSNNVLTQIPSAAFVHTPSLMILNLNYNNIPRLESKAFSPLSSLIRLELSGCNINWIAKDAFRGLRKLETLKLNGNKLKNIEQETVMSLERLYGIELQANPWNCDCALLPLRAWLSEYKIPHPLPLVCASPYRVAGQSLDELPPSSFACKPKIQPSPSFIDGFLGENTTVSCKVEAIPSANISWYHDGSRIVNGTKFLILEHGNEVKTSRLLIIDSEEQTSGNYQCRATNAAGADEMNLTVGLTSPSILNAGLTYDQVAGVILGLIVLIIVILAIIVILLFKIRRSHRQEKEELYKESQQQTMSNGKASSINGSMAHGSTITIKETSLLNSNGVHFNPSPMPGSIEVAFNGSVSHGYMNHNPDLLSDVDGVGVYNDYNYPPPSRPPHPGIYGQAVLGTDDLYPVRLWGHDPLPPPVPPLPAMSEDGSDFNNQFTNSSCGEPSYDAYEPPKHSTPLRPSGRHQAAYPPDYGLPILPQPSDPQTSHRSVNYRPTETLIDGPPPVISSQSPAHSASSTNSGASPPSTTSGGTAASKSRVKSQGVCVLPPLPSAFKAKQEDSPDEGYQEEGTEV